MYEGDTTTIILFRRCIAQLFVAIFINITTFVSFL